MLNVVDSLGYYVPSFFKIFINTDKKLVNPFKLPTQEFTIFIHEYIHFLQDILTPFGLKNIEHYQQVINEYNLYVNNSTNSIINLPIILEGENIVMTNRDLFSLYIGQNKIKYKIDRITNIEITPNGLIKNKENVEEVIVYYYNKETNSIKNFQFGSFCILESMADLIESSYIKSKAPVFPYKIVEKIIDFYYPNQFSIEQKVLICENALSSSNPGATFIKLLKYISTNELKFHSLIKLKEYIGQFRHFVRNKPLDNNKIFIRSSIQAEQALYYYFKNDSKFNDIIPWINHIFKIIRHLKSVDFSFTDLVGNKLINKLHELYINLGTPVMINNKDKFSFHYPKDLKQIPKSLLIFPVINDVYRVLQGYKTKCSLLFYCKNYKGKDITQKECYSTPWRVFHGGCIICPFRRLWCGWGFWNKNYKLK
ncbi:MAG: hypothetical protein ACLFVR_07150 [Thiohalospira sp.]